MQRKVISLGPTTLVVSLPASWVKQQNIKPASMLHVQTTGKALIITKNHKNTTLAKLDYSKIPHMYKRLLSAMYMKGAEQIQVKTKNAQQARLVQQHTQQLVGMGVIEQQRDVLVLKNIGGDAKEDPHAIIKRLFFLVGTFGDELLSTFSSQEIQLSYLQDMEKNINRFTEFGVRLLLTSSTLAADKTPIFYTLYNQLEEVGDLYKKLAAFAHEHSFVFPKPLLSLFSDLLVYFREVESLYKKFSLEQAAALGLIYDHLEKKLSRKLAKTNSKEEIQVLLLMKQNLHIYVKIVGELVMLN